MPIDDLKKKDFLKRMSQLESSSGKNLNHKPATSGVNVGQSAYGEYGLMPTTVKEMMNRQPNREDYTSLMQMDNSELKDFMARNPELEQFIANKLADKVLSEQVSPEAAAYAWNSGHNLKPDQVAQRNILDNPHVKKFVNTETDYPRSESTETYQSPYQKVLNLLKKPIGEEDGER